MTTISTAEALSTGAGRDGHVRSSEGPLDLDVAAPKEMGGSGAGANPEMLFAAGLRGVLPQHAERHQRPAR